MEGGWGGGMGGRGRVFVKDELWRGRHGLVYQMRASVGCVMDMCSLDNEV
jgi:hypothetical protein